MIVLIDNYDSFVYNLYQFLAETGQEVRVARNDRISPEEVLAMAPDGWECVSDIRRSARRSGPVSFTRAD